MFARLCVSAAAALFATTAVAQDLTDSHEQVSVPGKTVVAYRPLAQSRAVTAKCHPDATKAVACEAAAQRDRVEALAAAQRDARPIELGRR